VGTVIEAWATYKSWDFRQAYVSYYASIYDLSDSDRATLLRSQLEASRASHEFHVAVQMTTDKWNDLERKNSPWRVTLLDASGGELGPASIQTVKLPELYESQFFPSRTEFTRTYEISFALTSSAGSLFLARQAVVSSCVCQPCRPDRASLGLEVAPAVGKAGFRRVAWMARGRRDLPVSFAGRLIEVSEVVLGLAFVEVGLAGKEVTLDGTEGTADTAASTLAGLRCAVV